MDIGHAVKCVTTGVPALLTGGKPGCRAGEERLAWFKPGLEAQQEVSIRSDAFENLSAIPGKYSADELAISPPIRWLSVPDQAKSLALVVEDPDAPTPNPFVHWLIYNILADVRELPEDVRHEEISAAARGAMQGKNSGLKIGWAGMAPPKGDTPHHYHFQLFAIDRMLDLEPRAGRTALFEAMAGHVIARGHLIGTYQR